MTQEEHDILIQNNLMLKQIIQYINLKESSKNRQDDDLREFMINIMANNIVNA